MSRSRTSSPAKKPAARGAASTSGEPTKAALLRRIEALESRLDALERLVARASPPRQEPARANLDDLEPVVVDTLLALDREQRLDGLVPIPHVRRRLSGFLRADLDRVLLTLERRFRIDLKIANDPMSIEAPSDGISHPDRGLLYYAALR